MVSHCVQCDLPPPSMFNRYIYYALLRTAIAQINVKLSLRRAECILKQDSQLYLSKCAVKFDSQRFGFAKINYAELAYGLREGWSVVVTTTRVWVRTGNTARAVVFKAAAKNLGVYPFRLIG